MIQTLKMTSGSSTKNDLEFNLCEEPENNIYSLLKDYPFIKSNTKIEYMNIPCAFDIESTSIIDECENKIAFMYAFTLNINGRHILGRTWDEFINFIDIIREYYNLNDNKRIIIYVHNLAYEFQFMKCRFKWDKIFALKSREVVKAVTQGIEFRCSLILSGYKLANLSDKLHKYKIEKMVGDLDYSLIRHSNTYLTPKELKYIYHDGLVVVAWIKERIEEENNNISNIPLTKTGYTRRYCRNKCLYDGNHSKNSSKYLKYRKIINSLTITSKEEYLQLKRAYIGAHTHGNPLAVGEILHNVYSMDFTSSYPYVMLSETSYPMSKGRRIKITSKEMFNEYINLYCCIFDITFINIESTTPYEHLIPGSKCYYKENCLLDNGKVVRARVLSMSLNEVDFKTFSKFYKWDEIRIKNFRYYMKGYLPKDFILSILHLYKNKTELKGVVGSELDYLKAKENLNSAYG